MLKITAIVICLLSLSCIVHGQVPVAGCMTTKLEPGTCKPIRECDPIVKALLKDRTFKPTICDYATRTICCPVQVVKTVPTPVPVSSNRISEQKCREYGQNVYETTVLQPSIIGEEAVVKKRNKCSHTVVPLIVGGELSKEREFPHMALIGYWNGISEEYSCGGSLISAKFILSAAHCASSGRSGKAKYAKVGDVRRQQDNPNTYKYNILTIINHPEYTKKGKDHDIALFKLDKSVTFNDYVIPACLPQSDILTKTAIATGWGITGFSEAVTNELHKVVLDIFGQPECQMSYQYEVLSNGIDYKRMFCAGSHNDTRDTCSGDSGGPIQIYNTDVYCMYTILGVTSFGTNFCGTPGVPGVYSRVYYYLDWIEDIVWGAELREQTE